MTPAENTADTALDPALLAAATTAMPPAAAPADQAAAPGAPGTAAAVVMTPDMWQQEARAMWGLVAMLSMRWPSVKAVYPDDELDRLAVAWAPVLQRHDITAGKYMIYLVAAGATMPVLSKTVEAIREDRAAAAAEKAAELAKAEGAA